MHSTIVEKIEKCLQRKRLSEIDGFYVITDPIEYSEVNQVFPLHPENQFFLDEIIEDKIRGAEVLEIGIGSGVLSIGAIRKGARKVIGLEVNPRARNYAGFNILLNGLEDAIEIREGNDDIFKPVEGRRFGYFMSNPPFEPTPPNATNYTHSSAGPYGLDFVEKILQGLDMHLADNGHAQIVSFSPGNEREPHMLIDLVKKYLKGKVQIKVNPESMKFDDFVDRFIHIGQATDEQVEEMKSRAKKDNVTHLYLCMLHYERGINSLDLSQPLKSYSNWDLPIDSAVPMGYIK